MSSISAQLLVGHCHPNGGGLNPTHMLLLSEGSRPAWTLYSLDIAGENQTPGEVICWIPTVEHMLEDGILMAHACAMKIPEVRDAVSPLVALDSTELPCLYDALDSEALSKARALCKTLSAGKIVITALAGSTLLSQLSILSEYQTDVEVCPAVYLREYSEWKGKVIEQGKLEGPNL